LLVVIADVLKKWAREAAARRQYAKAREAFARLDAASIRDLGMSRSEFSSYWAESHDLAERTRMRVAQRAIRNDDGAEVQPRNSSGSAQPAAVGCAGRK
jgi:uncharacterized protein YjiS (DUF1127 family)